MAAKEKVFFPNLDGLRFFAFLLVFLQHGFGKTINTLGFEKDTNNLFFSTIYCRRSRSFILFCIKRIPDYLFDSY